MILALFLACTGPRPVAEPPPEAPAAEAPAEAAAPSGAAPADGAVAPVDGVPTDEPGTGSTPTLPRTPAEAYASCKERLEGVEAAGECTTDADCARAGCSQEVCVAKANAADVMSTCEMLPCFQAVESCGCHEGVCSWTLRSEMPAPRPIPLPAK